MPLQVLEWLKALLAVKCLYCNPTQVQMWAGTEAHLSKLVSRPGSTGSVKEVAAVAQTIRQLPYFGYVPELWA